MAQVFAAVAEGHGLERRVAIKRMLGAIADDAARAMFLDEARIASQLHHGSIVQVLDFGVVEQDPFMVLELVDGLDVGRAARLGRANGHPIPEGVALHVCAEVAHALAYVHARTDDAGRSLGIVHRDVSPGNVLCSWEGDVKLSDFGIALALSRAEKTAAGVVKGKPGYMAPEQGLGREVWGAADVFALGNTLHTMLTGAPVRGEDELPWWLTEGRAPPVSPALPDDLRALVREMLAVSPERRPSADTVATRCEALLRPRLETGPRSALRTWLADVRVHVEPDAALDQLFDLAIVPAAADEATRPGEAARFDVVRLSPSATTRARDERTLAPTGVAAPVARRPIGATRARTWALAGLGLIPLAAIGVVLSLEPPPPRVTTPPRQAPEGASLTPPVSATHSPEPPSPTADAPREPAPSAPTSPTAEGEHAASSEPAPLRRASSGMPRVSSSREAPPAQAEAPARGAEPAPELGWLRIGSAELAGAALEIDGARVGYLPALRRLAAGRHRVVVRALEGEGVVLERDVLVTPEHTQSSPLVVR